MAYTEKPYDFLPPGGQFQVLVGPIVVTSTVVAPTKMVTRIGTTGTIVTITPPHEGFVGPLYLVADSVFAWTTAGNIDTVLGTTLKAGYAYGFIYDPAAGGWIPLGAGDV